MDHALTKEDPEMRGVSTGRNGEEEVDLDYTPIAPEMPTVREEDQKWTKRVKDKLTGAGKSKKGGKKEGQEGQERETSLHYVYPKAPGQS